MLIHNTSGWEVELETGYQVNNHHLVQRKYKIKPFSRIDIFESSHVRLIMKKRYNRENGIVHMHYDEQMQAKYPTFEEFEHAQIMNGLRELKKRHEYLWTREKQAQKDIVQKGGNEADKGTIDLEKFDNNIKLVDKWIAEEKARYNKKNVVLSNQEEETEEEERPIKKMGRPKRVLVKAKGDELAGHGLTNN